MLVEWLQLMFHCTGVAVAPLLASLPDRGHFQLHQDSPMVVQQLKQPQLEEPSLVYYMILEKATAFEREGFPAQYH